MDDKAQLRTGVYTVKATGENETRELHLAKLTNGHYRVQVWWGRQNKALATMEFTEGEWKKLASYSEGLKRK